VRKVTFRKRVRSFGVPQKCRALFEGRCLGEGDGAHAAIDRTFFCDGRHRRIHHGQIRRFEALPFHHRRATVLESAHVLRAIAAAAWIFTRLGSDEAPAHIGVEGSRRHGEFGGSVASGQIERIIRIIHIDYANQD